MFDWFCFEINSFQFQMLYFFKDEKHLIESVSVIFHSAATVKFDEELTK